MYYSKLTIIGIYVHQKLEIIFESFSKTVGLSFSLWNCPHADFKPECNSTAFNVEYALKLRILYVYQYYVDYIVTIQF